jgi:hypothetical protein
MTADAQEMKEGPGGEAGAFKETSQSRDQGALDAPILSQGTNQARRGSRKRRPTAAASDGSANFDDANSTIGRSV